MADLITLEVGGANPPTEEQKQQIRAALEVASDAQGALADSALQPGDNVSQLVNDAGYMTSALGGLVETDWHSLVMRWTAIPVIHPTAPAGAFTGGRVFTSTYGPTTLYRFISPDPYSAAADAFYTT